MYDILKGSKKPGNTSVDAYFTCNLFIGLDKKTGSLVYFNLDSVSYNNSIKKQSSIETNVNKLQNIDKFYGFGQSHIIKTKVYPISED